MAQRPTTSSSNCVLRADMRDGEKEVSSWDRERLPSPKGVRLSRSKCKQITKFWPTVSPSSSFALDLMPGMRM